MKPFYSQRERIKENKDLYEYENFPLDFSTSLFAFIQNISNIHPKELRVLLKTLEIHAGYGISDTTNQFLQYALSSSKSKRNSEILYNEKALKSFFDDHKNKKKFILDLIEGLFSILIPDEIPEKKISTIQFINEKFREYGLGYQCNNGQIIKISDTHIYQEVTAPALEILRNPKYELVNEEYRTAFHHLKNNHFKDCITSCARALETFLKLIFKERTWPYSETATLRTLLEVATKHTLFPAHLAGTLEQIIQNTGGIRNKSGGHGSDSKTEEPSLELAEYVLHLTASHIIFLDKLSV